VASHQVPTDRTMCSEFVTYCYQSKKDDPQVKLDAQRTTPMRLEDYLNAHPDLFRFAGAIHGSGKKGAGISGKKVLADIKGELEENVQHVGQDMKKAGEKLKSIFRKRKK